MVLWVKVVSRIIAGYLWSSISMVFNVSLWRESIGKSPEVYSAYKNMLLLSERV